ncbi:MAG: hypothetical protein L6R36_000234 [Xanthoria steineri]|nr:MAG: hypothetical protein L6R36_000234 [Xanthoria steineri]
MSLPSFNTKSPTIKRILKEATELRSNPDPTLHAAPVEDNLFVWHFTLQGPPSTPYASGIYHGRITLPPSYPLRPPSFRFYTPSGRFEVNREICLSISGHHEETWQPAWGIRTALWALRAFMEGGAQGQVGGMEMGEAERKRLAGESRGWKCDQCGGCTNEDILREEGKRCEELGHEASTKADAKDQVPEELRFGFKDEMGKEQATDKGKGKEQSSADGRRDEKATGQKRSSEDSAGLMDLTAVPAPVPLLPPPAPTISPAQSLPQQVPTRTTSVPASAAENGVPGWVDKAIIGVIAGLFVMVVKKILI